MKEKELTKTQKGKVYLAGAGPGDLEYLSVKTYRLLSQAEVLVYDALVNTELFSLVSDDCLLLNVGKRGGKPSTSQDEINQLLVKYAQEGKLVLRLKSGDPFIFGRCIHEIQTLQANDCEYELIPGISSAFAAPLFVGIPLTDINLSRYFVVVSAHQPEILDWETLAKIDTLAILMGTKNLSEIIDRLVENQRSLDTPIAIIRWAGTSKQQIWIGTLRNICSQVSGISLSPAMIIIGEVVKLASVVNPDIHRTTEG